MAVVLLSVTMIVSIITLIFNGHHSEKIRQQNHAYRHCARSQRRRGHRRPGTQQTRGGEGIYRVPRAGGRPAAGVYARTAALSPGRRQSAGYRQNGLYSAAGDPLLLPAAGEGARKRGRAVAAGVRDADDPAFCH